jgi:hypothetical protein
MHGYLIMMSILMIPETKKWDLGFLVQGFRVDLRIFENGKFL